MKSPFVAELQPDQTIQAVFLVQTKDIRQKKSGDPFLSLVLADKTGEIDAKMWDNAAEVMDTFEREHFVRVKGLVQIFQNKLQLTVHKLQRVGDHEVDFADFFPASARDADEMFRELEGIIAGMANPHLRGLLQAFFADADIATRYKKAPAAKSIHHAWFGGLLEHVLSLCALARMTAPHYSVDLDLVLTGVILHDIGKLDELSYERTFNYTDDGQLLGHIVIGAKMLNEKLRLVPDFPPRLAKLVEHLILSHHGTLEYGSPKQPLFPEALLLHFLDNLDSKMAAMANALQRDGRVEGAWTGYINALERPVLKKDVYLNPPPPGNPPTPAAPSGSSNGDRRAPSSSDFASKLAGALKG